jgi:hypothetical protein
MGKFTQMLMTSGGLLVGGALVWVLVGYAVQGGGQGQGKPPGRLRPRGPSRGWLIPEKQQQVVENDQALADIVRWGGQIQRDPADPEGPVVYVGLQGIQDIDAALDQVKKGLPRLRRLCLSHTPVSDASLARLEGWTGLQMLDLSHTTISDAGLEHLKGLTSLQSLHLYVTKVTGPGLAHLKGLVNLRELSLFNTEVNDAGLANLQGLTQLRTLYLGDTRVTDAGLAHLRGLKSLRTLGLHNTAVSEQAAEELRKQIPDLDVLRGPLISGFPLPGGRR